MPLTATTTVETSENFYHWEYHLSTHSFDSTLTAKGNLMYETEELATLIGLTF